MATVKLSWVENAYAHQSYLTKDRNSETIDTRDSIYGDDLVKEFENIHDQHNSRAKNLYLQIVQSWSPEESKLFEPQKFNDMGMELAKSMFPDHQIQVVTHQDTKHIHNHIIVNTVNSITGRAIPNKKALIYNLRDANDSICKSHGLSVLTPTLQSQEAKLPQKARDMVVRGKKSYLYDIMQKADFARSASTSFDEYTSLLKVMGVDARVENKNITYFYGDKTKGKRGKGLGTNYNNDGLIKAFKENDEKFNRDPGLRARLRGDIAAITDPKGNLVGTPSDVLLASAGHAKFRAKDYSEFTKVDRRNTRSEHSAPTRYNGIIPISEIKRASERSILDYCEHHKISLYNNDKGQTVLRGREFVVIHGNSWTNTKNHTKGSLIDFVANHHDITFLQAIAKINNNPRLLQLESVTGEVKRKFTSFYIPKEKELDLKSAMKVISTFPKMRGVSETHVKDLMALKKLQVSQSGSIWIFGGSKGEFAHEYTSQNGNWTKKNHGENFFAFETHKGVSSKAVVFPDLFDFMRNHEKAKANLKRDSLFVAMDMNSDKALNHFLAENPHIKQIDFIFSQDPNKRAIELDHVQKLKNTLDPFTIKVSGIELDDFSRGKGLSRDI